MKFTPLRFCLVAGLFVSCGDDHAGHDHSHQVPAKEEQAGHAHAAPHGGLLVVLAEEFAHLELLHDPATGDLRAFALGAHAESPVRLTQPSIDITIQGVDGVLSLKAVPSSLSGETVGDTSEFQLRNAALKGIQVESGVIQRIDMLGQTFEAVAFSKEH